MSVDMGVVVGRVDVLALRRFLRSNADYTSFVRRNTPFAIVYKWDDGTEVSRYRRFDEDLRYLVRFQVNPNRRELAFRHALCSHMQNAHITRMDVAVDYLGADFDSFVFGRARVRTIEEQLDMATKYRYGVLLGSMSSDRHTMVYDYSNWHGGELCVRFEERVQLDRIPNCRVLPPDLFAGITIQPARIIVAPSSCKGGWREAAALEYLARHPEAASLLDRRTRRAYRERLQSFTSESFPVTPEHAARHASHWIAREGFRLIGLSNRAS